MTEFNRFFVTFLFTSLLIAYTPLIQADMQQQGYGNMTYTPVIEAYEPQKQVSYGRKIGKKALSGWTNLSLGWLEIPKNIINTTNQSNFFYGVFGGFLKGLVNTLGRMGVGIADLLTFPLPTKPIAHPLFIWDNFDVDTTYGEVFRLNKTQKIDQPVTQAPVTAQPVQTAIATPAKAAEVDRSYMYNQDTNRKLDTLFTKEMQK
ncbi:MAG: exosortase system-associated protein, TIGR04073 family [Methylococcales bacterium]|nr:exosortase system-associated protein, TIGR04073 family [Methylococcales bacterium]